MVAISIFESFESHAVARTGVVPLPDPKTERNLGGHAVAQRGRERARAVALLAPAPLSLACRSSRFRVSMAESFDTCEMLGVACPQNARFAWVGSTGLACVPSVPCVRACVSAGGRACGRGRRAEGR